LFQHSYSGKASDIWALGASLYALVFGNVPFVANSVPAVYEKIKNDELTFPNRPTISDQLRDLLVNILEKDPAKRLTLPQIKVCKIFERLPGEAFARCCQLHFRRNVTVVLKL
jgi:calcium/calmodulin-dependent protein kinase kinase 2